MLAALLPRVADGQWSRGEVELGAALLKHRDVSATHAATAGLAGRLEGQRYAVGASGALAFAGDARSTGQGLLTASLFTRPPGRNRWELGGAATGFVQGASPLTGGVYVFARDHFQWGRNSGAWVGAAFGGVEDAEYWSPTGTAEIGWWRLRPETRLTAAAVLVETRSEPYALGGNIVTDRVTYADASLRIAWVKQRFDVEALGGLRVIQRGALTATGRGTRPFASVDAAVWLTPRVALVAGVGRHLSDLTRGTPDTRYAALAIRVSMRDRPATRAPARRAPTESAVTLALVADNTGRSRLVVDAPSAGSVDLVASFTSWEPVALVRRGDRWELEQLVPTGAHRVLLRVDGGAWIVPPNLPATADDFGGTVGILIVP